MSMLRIYCFFINPLIDSLGSENNFSTIHEWSVMTTLCTRKKQRMDSNVKLEDMLKQLDCFLRDKIKGFDVVISRERSGYRIFQALEENYMKSGVLHIPSKSVHLLNLQGAKVLLFDDVTTSGTKLQEMSKALMEHGAKVDTMVYAVLDTCSRENRPTYFVRVVNFKEFQEITHHISESMKELGLPLDTDHIQIEGTISPASKTCTEIYESIASLGDVYEGAELPGGCQYGLRNPNFCSPSSLKLPYLNKSAGTWKLRIKYTMDGKVKIIPLTFPVLEQTKGTCLREQTTNFCERYESPFKGNNQSQMLLCCFCVIYNSSEKLLLSFFESWKRSLDAKEMKFNLEKVVYEDARSIFNDVELENRLSLQIHNILIQ
jgi:hypothetical protein